MKRKIAFVVSTPQTASAFLISYFKTLSQEYELTLFSNFSSGNYTKDDFGVSNIVHVDIRREINIFSDIKTLIFLMINLRRFDAVHTVTPKAGLLGGLASFLTRVPIRIHTFTGQVWATKTGLFKRFLKSLDRLIFLCTTHCLVDSKSQQKFLIDNDIISEKKSSVLGHGSISGVDVEKFHHSSVDRVNIRKNLGISDKDFVFLFLGRINHDKGVRELVESFSRLSAEYKDCVLLVVGPVEPVMHFEFESLFDVERLKYLGPKDNPVPYYSASDAFILPSYREGFGTVIIEANACKLPALASDIYGLNDAVVDQYTGLLFEVKNVNDIYHKMKLLKSDDELRSNLSQNGYERVLLNFDSKVMDKLLLEFYKFNFDKAL